ncbi:Polyol phosphate phosphatase PYP1 [Fulvia fulva]|uniref:Polyol phosphate phosphatase PYP1 n=1 Tax=Passalora fulva TaxID=5499 RepID=A0A9Q8UT16_PASFU|nr:Polyol phosphate phosphatase PYP1 [Fulvia fulva]KAK4617949.1 Polyol phosphate phosphatase PYP1 [Fulvia fulva]KAK4618794.1 Polyol phosphate phosphatase PYP1 [Fulvia fulva]UJO21368.1 Polyol phosphate phosphatase PYP1 [Fulvia fulva]WPV18207.1 Polyol phosphate phosphatase PYP1 [Fulvia fulva]WPV33162.1 Polyol phosphate phosphatase PYP1 [Fulvia fulva]
MVSAPVSDLKAMNEPFKNPKFIFFTDFDGTITLQDSNDFMTDNIGFGGDKRRQGNRDVLEAKDTFRDSFRKMMDSVTKPFPECIDYLVSNIKLDPGFNEYFQWALKNEIPTVVVSSGMEPIIRAILKNLIGPDHVKLDIISNQAEARPGKSIDQEGGWQIQYHDESSFGHDKSLTLRPYAQLPKDVRPTLFYAGDGVSDLSAAKETDLLFAKQGHDLIRYCVKEDVPFTVFKDWHDIHSVVKKIVAGDISVHDAAKQGWEDYKSGAAGVNGKPL